MENINLELQNLSFNRIDYRIIKHDDKIRIIEIQIRKSLVINIQLSKDYPNPNTISAKVYSFNTQGLKPTRQKVIQEYLDLANIELDSEITLNPNKFIIASLYQKCLDLLENQEFLTESLNVLEDRIQNDKKSLLKTDSTSENEEKTDSKKSNKKKVSKNKKESKNEEKETKNHKFKGSDFIFQRIKWDNQIDKEQVIIGYIDRFLGIKEIKFNDFKGVHEDLEGVPLHRIRYFKLNDKIVWDRDSKIDLITGAGDISSFFSNKKQDQILVEDYLDQTTEFPESESEQKITDCLVYEFKSNSWSECCLEQDSGLPNFFDKFSILTYNIMSKNNFKKSIISKMNFKKSTAEVLNRNEYDKDELGLKNLYEIDRMPKIIELLEQEKPNFVLLQECEEYEETKLKESEFIQKNYYLCSSKRNDKTNPHSNCIILSKLKPVFFKNLKLIKNSNKSALIIKLNLRNDSLRKIETVLLINVHLTSNKSNDFIFKRKQQLECLKEYLIDRKDEFDLHADYTFLCGDFNFGDLVENENELINELFLKNGFNDYVKNYSTFDPKSNFSASITAFKQEPRRLDRILLKANPNKLDIIDSFLVNTAPFRINPEDPIVYEPYLNIGTFITNNKLAISENSVRVSNKLITITRFENSEFYLHPSDHYGLEFVLQFKNSLHETNLIHKSALSVLVPKDLSEEFIQKVRSDFDPQISRWPPHINILYPFYLNLNFDLNQEASVIADILQCLSKFNPFDCDLNEISLFKNNNVFFLEPCDKAVQNLKKIYQELKILFEDEKNLKWNRESLSPHLTIGQPADKKTCDKKWAENNLEKIKSNYRDFLFNKKPICSFKVDCLYWITRSDSTPFQIKFAFPLGQRYPSTITGLEASFLNNTNRLLNFLYENKAILSEKENNQLDLANEKLKSKILNSTGLNDCLLTTIGSYQLGIRTNDLDFCLVKPKVEFEDNYTKSLAYNLAQGTDMFHVIRNIEDAIVPIIELCLKAELFESAVYGADIQVYEVLDERFKNKNNLFFDSNSYMIDLSSQIHDYNKLYPISGLFENQNLKKFIPYYKDFQVLLAFVKLWAKRRNIYGKAFGYLGGISWSLLVAFFLQNTHEQFVHILSLENSDTRFKKLIREFFKFYSKWHWSEPISLVNLEHVSNVFNKYQQKSSIMILQTLYPYHNTSKNVTEKSKKVIQNEFKRCFEILDQSENYELACENVIVLSKRIKFEILFNNSDDMNHILTLIKAKIQGLITSLQKINQKFDFRTYTDFYETEKDTKLDYKYSRFFYIGLNDLIFDLNQTEKQLIETNCSSFINSIYSLTHLNNFKILYEFNF